MSNNLNFTRDIDGIEEVEKLVSLNPDIYKRMDVLPLLDEYSIYCYNLGSIKADSYKTFKEWLMTEI